jgi:predicted DNA-binding transcriptional regulator AlpA
MIFCHYLANSGSNRREEFKKGALLADCYTRQELADALGYALLTIERWNKAGTGPPSFKIGHQWYYEKSAVQKWMETRGAATRGGRHITSTYVNF